LALALSFNLTDAIQRLVPDYTQGLSSDAATAANIRDLVSGSGKGLSACANTPSESLANCGKAPNFAGISSWFNTADNKPVNAADLTGKVVLIDFWAYSCINCQRAIPHVEAWFKQYHDAGLEVIGVHTPEYAFEYDRGNVVDGAKRLGITYPVALDNNYGTWDAFANQSWPAEYLIDSRGYVRHVSIGEGDYGGTEKLIRRLLTDAKPSAQLAGPTQVPDTTPQTAQSQETYLDSERGQFYAGQPALSQGTHSFSFVNQIADNQFSLRGTWTVSTQYLTAGPGAALAQAFTASKVYLDVGGTGTLTAHVNGKVKTFQVSGAPNIYTVVDLPSSATGIVLIGVSPGLQVYSFTYG
jgi:thiol-disulfide isomerase/thioredoxin